MKPKGLYNYSITTNLKYKQLSISRQMNRLAMEGEKTIDGGLLKRKFWLGRDLCFIIFLAFGCFGVFSLDLFVCCFVSSSPSSNKLSPRESYLTNLLQTHNLQVPTHLHIPFTQNLNQSTKYHYLVAIHIINYP